MVVLGDDAAPAARDDARQAAYVAPLHEFLDEVGTGVGPPELLLVPVTRNEEVEAEALVQSPEPSGVNAAREVGHGDLPARRGSDQGLLHPNLRLHVGPPKPILASPQIRHAIVFPASRPLRVVIRADVVLHVLLRGLRIEGVGVDDKVLGYETFVLHLAAEVPGGHDPIVIHERIADGLRPPIQHHVTAIIVVAECANPRNHRQVAVHRNPHLIHVLDHLPLIPRRLVAIRHGATPVQAIPNVEHVLGLRP
mmetsp:Transcript_54425/g.107522  ORF Transcript_54425/g.107522 Transcript_54425/m.107522 type:complete len:252 (-) Transcript_54425:32-787(-)